MLDHNFIFQSLKLLLQNWNIAAICDNIWNFVVVLCSKIKNNNNNDNKSRKSHLNHIERWNFSTMIFPYQSIADSSGWREIHSTKSICEEEEVLKTWKSQKEKKILTCEVKMDQKIVIFWELLKIYSQSKKGMASQNEPTQNNIYYSGSFQKYFSILPKIPANDIITTNST